MEISEHRWFTPPRAVGSGMALLMPSLHHRVDGVGTSFPEGGWGGGWWVVVGVGGGGVGRFNLSRWGHEFRQIFSMFLGAPRPK